MLCNVSKFISHHQMKNDHIDTVALKEQLLSSKVPNFWCVPLIFIKVSILSRIIDMVANNFPTYGLYISLTASINLIFL